MKKPTKAEIKQSIQWEIMNIKEFFNKYQEDLNKDMVQVFMNNTEYLFVDGKLDCSIKSYNEIRFKSLGGKIPTKAHKTDAGYDLYSNENTVVRPGETVKVKTGICVGFPEGYWGKVFDRSSVGSKGLLVNAGVIDQGYISEIIVCLTNLSNGSDDDTFIINKGDKIAQMVLMQNIHFDIVEVDELEETDRGEKGFGSSGV